MSRRYTQRTLWLRPTRECARPAPHAEPHPAETIASQANQIAWQRDKAITLTRLERAARILLSAQRWAACCRTETAQEAANKGALRQASDLRGHEAREQLLHATIRGSCGRKLGQIRAQLEAARRISHRELARTDVATDVGGRERETQPSVPHLEHSKQAARDHTCNQTA